MPVDGRPFSRAAVAKLCASSSTRATSRTRTVEPSRPARSTMSANCAVSVSWPLTTTDAAIDCPGTCGVSPMDPDDT